MVDLEMADLERLWGQGTVRAFISHIAEDKKLATDMKNELANYGIASFVAHEDIEPMEEWETEIKRALLSMDLLIALLTEKFSDSKWTDQEIGAAFGRGIPVIPIRIGKDPYGLIGRYQAISVSGVNGIQVGKGIVEFLFKYQGNDDRLRELGKDIYIEAMRQADSFSQANYLAQFLSRFDTLSTTQANLFVESFNGNPQVYRAFEFHPIAAGELSRLTGDEYALRRDKFDQSTRWLERATVVDLDKLPF